jgi:diguanylate cyclase (GGDEF)-like protein
VKTTDKSFWWTSGLVATVTIASLLGLYEWQGQNLLVAAETRSDTQTVRALGNVLWPTHGQFIQSATQLSAENLRQHPQQMALLDAVKVAVRELPVLKVKIYSPQDGRIVFSTEAKQIGEITDHSAGLQAARVGVESSDLSHRPKFNSINGPVFNRDLVGTYVPYYANGKKSPEDKPSMIVEIYSDATDRLVSHRESRLKVVLGVSGTLLLLYLGVYLFSRKTSNALIQADLQRQLDEKRIRHQAFHDGLTGLPNRAGFDEFLKSDQCPNAKIGMGILFIDVDRFKHVNDSLGQKAGDLALQSISNRIQTILKSTDIAFRNGGDEFIVVTRLGDGRYLNGLAEKMIDSVRQTIAVDGTNINLTISVGMARWPQDSAKIEQAVRCADMAMQAAKAAGSNQVEFYRPEMKRVFDEQLLMLNGLQKAHEQSEFLLFYQPRLNAKSRKIESVEALIRWQHPKAGLIQPARFITALEESPLIIDVGRWVIQTACEQLVRWQAAGFASLRVSVNVAARQFRQANFVAEVTEILATTGLHAQCLELELTEGQLVTDLASAAATLAELQKLGVTVSIDDFGTGYSSLSYLHKLPINCIKIDRSFVMSITEDTRSGSIAKTIAALGHNLDLKVVAEGVETASQADMLTAWGCEQLQGFLFSKPVAHEQITCLMEKEHSSIKASVLASKNLAEMVHC